MSASAYGPDQRIADFECACREGRFDDANTMLSMHVPSRVEIEESLTILMLGTYGRDHLPAFGAFWDAVERHMQAKLGHERTARLLANRPKLATASQHVDEDLGATK